MATVLPRMFSFLLLPLYTNILPEDEYGKVTIIFSYFIICNVILAYGMETAFFRFYQEKSQQKQVVNTSTLSLLFSSLLFVGIAWTFQGAIADFVEIDVNYIKLVIWILFLDAVVIIPFAYLRASQRPIKYAIIKIANVVINLSLNVYFLVYMSKMISPNSLIYHLFENQNEIHFIFISNFIASAFTLLALASFYFKISYKVDVKLWKQMMQYGWPVLIAGAAYSINETFDKILLSKMLPDAIAKAQVGIYGACYKLALFMTLFATAFRLGIEPFFFSQAKEKNAANTYAQITKYFVIFGAVIFLFVVTFIDILKVYIVRDPVYWEGIIIVPIVLLANFCLGIYHNLSVWYKVTDKTIIGAYISVVAAIITLVLNILLIPYISYIGSAIATLVAYSFMMLSSWWLGRKQYPIPYDLKKIGTYFGLSILFSTLSFYVFDSNYLVSVPLFLTFLLLLYFGERKEISRILKK
ncbi:oligosaccharide flippase family protein [Aquimarina sp. ERC-38]|uniref:lipopolysaccharide biosynthesis protein n=1 Tax=Aquimarina sp. ERC-38 TaxID=2949996 RepID=UPI00224633AB|nr:oligosaccharide flippase family protein [Aquimarina sp. ERC-38]UZO81663.1 oligosaccharide flippase family protein [Aquimarina sp. ERC-38]